MNLDTLTLSTGTMLTKHEGNLISKEAEGEQKCIPASGQILKRAQRPYAVSTGYRDFGPDYFMTPA